MGLIHDAGKGPVAIDTAVFIYFIEEHPRFLPVVQPLFEAIDAGKLRAVASELTLLETLVVPYRFGNDPLAARYEAFLAGSRNLHLVPISRGILRAAARLRAASRLKAPDAIQIASGLAEGCVSFVTNDRSLPDLPGLRILQLADYAPPATEVRDGFRRPRRKGTARR